MANFCRICNDDSKPRIDTYVTCNNCGSSACAQHHTWWPQSKNAYCTVCWPKVMADACESAVSGFKSISPGASDANQAIESLAAESGAIKEILAGEEVPLDTLDKLIRLLEGILEKLRGLQNEK